MIKIQLEAPEWLGWVLLALPVATVYLPLWILAARLYYRREKPWLREPGASAFVGFFWPIYFPCLLIAWAVRVGQE